MWTNEYPFDFQRKVCGINRLINTIQAWNDIANNGGTPYDCSATFITMRPVYFKKFFAGREVAVSRNRKTTIYSMWHKNGTEITCLFEDDNKEQEFIQLP